MDVTEVKTTIAGKIGQLSSRQKKRYKFILEVLDKTATRTDNYAGISEDLSERAAEMLEEYKENSGPLQCNFMRVDFKRELLRVSPWSTGGGGD